MTQADNSDPNLTAPSRVLTTLAHGGALPDSDTIVERARQAVTVALVNHAVNTPRPARTIGELCVAGIDGAHLTRVPTGPRIDRQIDAMAFAAAVNDATRDSDHEGALTAGQLTAQWVRSSAPRPSDLAAEERRSTASAIGVLLAFVAAMNPSRRLASSLPREVGECARPALIVFAEASDPAWQSHASEAVSGFTENTTTTTDTSVTPD